MNLRLVHLSTNMRSHYPTFMKNIWILQFPWQKSDICRNGKKTLLVYCANSIVPHKSNYSRATVSDLLLATLRGVLFLKDLAKKLPFQNTEPLPCPCSKMSYFSKCTLYFATFLRSCTWVPTLQIITADARGDDYCIGKLLSRAFTKWKKGHKSSNSSLLFSRRRDICWHSPNFKRRKKFANNHKNKNSYKCKTDVVLFCCCKNLKRLILFFYFLTLQF